MGTRIVVRDKGLSALLKRVSHGRAQVSVGVHEAEGSKEHGDEVTNLDVASFHEFGTPTIAPRSFIRAWADERQTENTERLRKIATAVVKGQIPSLEQGLERFGVLAVGDVQKRIADGIPPPLAESTVKAKGSSTPLIDSGQLRSSIAHRVKK